MKWLPWLVRVTNTASCWFTVRFPPDWPSLDDEPPMTARLTLDNRLRKARIAPFRRLEVDLDLTVGGNFDGDRQGVGVGHEVDSVTVLDALGSTRN